MEYPYTKKIRGRKLGLLSHAAVICFISACLLIFSCTYNSRAEARGAGGNLATLDTARGATYLSEEERDVVSEINKLRADPAGYAERYLVPRRKRYKGNLYRQTAGVNLLTDEGVHALDECIAELRRQKPLRPLRPARGLSRAASDHAADEAASGKIGHRGSDHSSVDSRISRYGEWHRSMGENISYGSETASEIVAALLIDDGVSSRGHRRNLLDASFGAVGVALDSHPRYGHVCVIDFATGYTDRVK